MENKKFQKAFTLIELLVVVAIISLLSSVVFTSLNGARAKARDAKRISEINEIQTALELYISKHDSLPEPASYGRSNVSPGMWNGLWDLSTNNAGSGFLSFLVADGDIAKSPADPLNTPAGDNGSPQPANYIYFYIIFPASYYYQGGNGCNYSQASYLIGATRLETYSSPPPGSGCSCLWKNLPDMFGTTYSFDYIRCGQF